MWNTLFGESTSLFDEFNWLSREMDRLFDPMGIPALRTAGVGFPAVNVATEEEKVHILLFAPGIDPARLDLSINGNMLTVKGIRGLPGVPEGTQAWVRERPAGQFVRTPSGRCQRSGAQPVYAEQRSLAFRRRFTLSGDLDPSGIDARLVNGVLTVRIPKKPAAQPRRIEVKCA